MNAPNAPDQAKPATTAPQPPMASGMTRPNSPTLPFLNDDGSKKRCTWLEQLNK